ncbi:reverse transcriptase domain-containing protein [Tanacetum coccineum]|uniref:Reverse transcriptase domain-containing protein n=1 Tax=Tanacetum coccineum TaxID=301880 RepID=A0ABQ4WWW3_9ASTR
MALWPFYQWGIDILGPLSESAEKVKFVILAIDYFTKWIEAKPLERIIRKEGKNFLWDNIVCQFGLPRIKSRITEPNLSTIHSKAGAKD